MSAYVALGPLEDVQQTIVFSTLPYHPKNRPFFVCLLIGNSHSILLALSYEFLYDKLINAKRQGAFHMNIGYIGVCGAMERTTALPLVR